MARPRTALADDVLEQLAGLAGEGMSVAGIARRLQLSRHIVATRLAGLAAGAAPAATPRRCAWPGCEQEPSFDAGACYFHLKVARGLITP